MLNMLNDIKYDKLEQSTNENNDKTIEIIINDEKENKGIFNNNITIEKNLQNEKKIRIENNSEQKAKIVYPTNLYSSLSFNWLYDIIKNRTEDKPLKLNSL